MKKRVISILLSAAMISSMVVAGGVTAHAEENVTLNVLMHMLMVWMSMTRW